MQPFHWNAQLNESRWLTYYLHLLHLSLIAAFYCLPLSVFYFFLVLGWLVAHWRYVLWRYSDKSSHWLQRIEYQNESWSVVIADQVYPAQLTQVTVWSWLIVLNFRDRESGRKYSAVIFNDSADAEVRRQLRVILRHLPVWN